MREKRQSEEERDREEGRKEGRQAAYEFGQT